MSLRTNALAMTLVIASGLSAAHAQAERIETKEKAINHKANPAPTQGASKSINFNFTNTEITDVIKAYAKASGQTFLIDPGVRGKITIILPRPVSPEEAFNLLTDSLAVNGFSYEDHDGTLVIKSARSTQRGYIPTVTELPPLKPERMMTMVFIPKHLPVQEINKRLRILPSKDGEMTPFEPSNKLIVTDYVSNLHRIAAIFKEIDVPSATSATANKVTQTQPENETPEK